VQPVGPSFRVERARDPRTDVQRAALKPRIIYKTFEIVDGRAIPRYSSRKPATGSYEIVVQ